LKQLDQQIRMLAFAMHHPKIVFNTWYLRRRGVVLGGGGLDIGLG